MNIIARRVSALAVVLGHWTVAGYSPAYAWGETGHSAVCEIAYAELEPSARSAVDELLALDNGSDSFAAACNWADGPPRQQAPNHYVNLPRNTSAIAQADCPLADTCLLTAVMEDSALLADATADPKRRLDSLKLLGHWAADVHQPLHVSFADDRGGNSVDAKILYNGEPVDTNLHAVWDDWIIERAIREDYVAIAARLHARIDDAARAAWGHDHPVEWANESFRLAIAPETGYCVQRGGACWYDADNLMLSTGEPRRRVAIDDAYLFRQRSVVEDRLMKAGLRLGALLNRLLR